MRKNVTLHFIFSVYIIHDTYLVLFVWYQFLNITQLNLR